MATITKNKLWPKPEYTAIIAEKGRLVAFFIKSVRDAIPARCPEGASEADYASFVADARDNAMAITTTVETAKWWETTIAPRLVGDFGYKYVPVDLENIITKKVMKLKTLMASEHELREAAYVARFGMSEEEKILANYTIQLYDNKFYVIVKNEKTGRYYISIPIRGEFKLDFPIAVGDKINPATWRENTYFAFDKKTKIVVFFNGETREKVENAIISHAKPTAEETASTTQRIRKDPLAEFRFSGMNVRNAKNVTEDELKKTFNLRNIYFGNSMPKGERQAHMNKAYESLYAMARVLGIDPKDIGLENFISLSFGARGRRGARAHYEFKTGIINLTRGCGAGTLAHEWGHAFEAFVKKNEETEGKNEEYATIKRDMRYNEDGKDNYYYKSSYLADGCPSKNQKKYWCEEGEMFARTFACFAHDKFTEANIRADYLVACSENDPHPDDDERFVLNRDFDNLFTEMKNRGALHTIAEQVRTPGEAVQTVVSSVKLFECSNGQFNLFEPIAATRA